MAVSFSSLKPQVVVSGMRAADAVRFYADTFGAKELSRKTYPNPNADVEPPYLVAEIEIASVVLVVSDRMDPTAPYDPKLAWEEHGGTGKGSGTFLRLVCDGVDEVVETMAEAGASAIAIWEDGGARIGGGQQPLCNWRVRDPFGVVWVLVPAGGPGGFRFT